jgi:AcrR family transcriptional regulator
MVLTGGNMAADRRQAAKAERRARIIEVATALFAREGYDRVTTRQVAEAAEVGMGTLFRHAGSKPALLVHVMNDRLEQGGRQATALIEQGSDFGPAAAAIVGPLIEEAASHPENLRAYQRETLFGAEPLRTLALDRLGEVEHLVADLLATRGRRVGVRAGVDLDEVARLVNDVVTMELVRAGAGHEDLGRIVARVQRAADLLVVGLVDPPS